MIASVKKQIDESSKSPGVYIFKDDKGQVIYVGKAKNLRERLKSYSQAASIQERSRAVDLKLQVLVSKIKSLEIIISSTESEALILESQLIKKYKPRYNIQLKDDKNYPYIRIDLKKDWPAFEIVRRFKSDGSVYFGPYTSTRYIKQLASVINEVFLLRKCSDVVFRTAKRPCINYDMHNCLAPCQAYVSRQDYLVIVSAVIDLLKGKVQKLVEDMKKEMILASDNMAFEEATRIRERIKVLETLSMRQGIINPNDTRDIDLITYRSFANSHYFNIAILRGGILIGMSNIELSGEGTREQALARFVTDYYLKNIVPELMILPFELNDDGVNELLKERRRKDIKGKKLLISTKSTSYIKSLRLMVEKNLDEFINRKLGLKNRWEKLSGELAKAFGFKLNNIKTVECYDVSNISGQHTVGVKVYFDTGSAKKDNYRRYKMKADHNSDDLSAMKELLERRLLHVDEDPLPELILIDGGRTQLKAVWNVFVKLHLKPGILSSIAKDKTRSKAMSQDQIYKIDDKGSIETVTLSLEALNLMKMIRDEAHRFAITYNRRSRQNF